MTQHEYVFVAISIVLGLAITRLLHTVAMLIRAHRRVRFHWSTAVWTLTVMAYILQFWWVGWGLRAIASWDFSDFVVLTFGSICIYGAAEMALPVPESGEPEDLLLHSQGLGRLSALSMLLYFAVGPYVNVVMFGNPLFASLLIPAVGMVQMGLIIGRPRWFVWLLPIFVVYSAVVIYLTA
jgi:hypothetical protein